LYFEKVSKANSVVYLCKKINILLKNLRIYT